MSNIFIAGGLTVQSKEGVQKCHTVGNVFSNAPLYWTYRFDVFSIVCCPTIVCNTISEKYKVHVGFLIANNIATTEYRLIYFLI